ncbi:putative reverse transcriptase domain-containing protein [Tanacetum coccineum]
MATTTEAGNRIPLLNNTNPNNMTPESIQAMIDQALLRNSTNGDGSHSRFKQVVSLTRLDCDDGMVKSEIRKQVVEPKVKGNDVPAYTERFQELTLICTKFVANETEKVDKYISGLPDNILWDVKSARPRREKKPYGGSLPKSTGNTNVANTQKGNGAAPKRNGCFECGAPEHFKRDCPKLKNKDVGNQNAQGWVYAVGNAEKRGNASGNPNSNAVTSTFLLNNHYASILFDTSADRSFISTAFSSLINIAPTPLENSYDVELAYGKQIKDVEII